MRLLILRHGQSYSNADPHAAALPEEEGDRLTDRGRAQAAAAARWLSDRAIDRLITSPMRRARETTDPIAAATGLEPEIDDGIHELRESDEYLSLPPEEQKLKRWSVWMAEHGDDPDWAPPGGESFNVVLGRVIAFKARLEALPADENVLVVSHGIFTRFFLVHSLLEDGFLAADVHRLWHLRTMNCGLSAFEPGERRHPADPDLSGWTCFAWMTRPWDDDAAALLPRLTDRG
jgi:broad specificity phosphatase PhoE